MLDEKEKIEQLTLRQRLSQPEVEKIHYSVGVMAYNEEGNIKRTLQAILEQKGDWTGLEEIIVVASGCTDNTVGVVQEMMEVEPRIQLLIQPRREGKASAINLFLQHARSSVLVMVGADIIPERDALGHLCAHFSDPAVGMVGARPLPVNDQYTFIGHAVHLLWQLHDRMARHSPKLGEVVAFRNVIHSIPTDTAVDEISIQSIIVKQGLRLVYEPHAVVYNKGPMTLRDFLKQRRRIYAGHLRVRSEQGYTASTMNAGAILREMLASSSSTMGTPREVLWTCGAVTLEGVARLQGYYDVKRKRSHHIWSAVSSTKTLEDEQRKLRRIYKTQSVIVFHISRKEADENDLQRKHEDRITLQMLRKLLPILHRYIRKSDQLSINGNNTLVALFDGDREGAELIAQRLKRVMESQLIPIGRNRYAQPVVNYHAVSFAL